LVAQADRAGLPGVVGVRWRVLCCGRRPSRSCSTPWSPGRSEPLQQIRTAAEADVEHIASLADWMRRQYAAYEPVFWRPADDAVARHREFITGLLADDDAIVLVSVTSEEPDQPAGINGFIIARLVPAPPVYQPGGAVCLVDDFVVSCADDWRSVGIDLLHAATAAAAERGAVHVVVVGGHHDQPKRNALAASGLHIGTEWWMSGLPLQP
jgi:hypothetical protein